MALVNNLGTGGAFPSALQPTQDKNLYRGNYLDFLDSTSPEGNTFAQQFLPDVYEKEVNKYGKRTIAGFLKMVSAEMPSTSDQIIWTEQGRLHTRYTNVKGSATIAANAKSATFVVPIAQQGPDLTPSLAGGRGLAFRVGQTVMIQRQGTGATLNQLNDNFKGTGTVVLKGIITAVIAGTGVTEAGRVTVFFYEPGKVAATVATINHTILVYGSEYGKGTDGMTGTVHPNYETFSNKPIIMKDHFSINGSDTSQIGWIEVSSENGASGYLWYIKSEHENRLRWEDYQEMSMIESVKAETGVNASTAVPSGTVRSGGSVDAPAVGSTGTEGFFQSLELRGHIYDGFATELAQENTIATQDNAIFDSILQNLDKQGAIEENMLYLNRANTLAIDNYLAKQNNYGATDGVSFGVFNNSKEMSLDLGFSGFRRGSYDFYKTDWKYLNDWSTRGGFADVTGTLIPAGSSTVYDEVAGGNVKRPFLHVRYRSSEADNRKMKSWITGSVGGAYTNDTDELRMHYLTERCLITQAPNNFFLFRG